MIAVAWAVAIRRVCGWGGWEKNALYSALERDPSESADVGWFVVALWWCRLEAGGEAVRSKFIDDRREHNKQGCKEPGI